MPEGKGVRQAKTTKNEVKRTILNSSVSSFSPPPSFDGSGVREANGQRLTSKQLTLNKQIINHFLVSLSPFGGRGSGGKNFKTMKKQILFLAFFTLALIFAGTNKGFGQLNPSPYTPASVPVPLTLCVGSAQQPKAGVPYIYRLDNTTADATGFRFWATKDPTFVSLDGTNTVTNQTDSLKRNYSTELFGYSDNYLTQSTTNEVSITWGPDILSRTSYQQGDIGYPGTITDPTSTFVVGWAENCADNIKVWEIDPRPAFTVDIKMLADATKLPLPYNEPDEEQCIDEVRAAKYNTTTFEVDYNFGWDTLYYEVIASNFVTSWVPTFFLTGLGDDAVQVATINWASSWANARTGVFIEGGDITGGSITGTTALTSVSPNTSTGVSLFVRVLIANNNYEGLAAQTILLSVAGEDAVGFDLTDEATCTPPADAATAAVDDGTSRVITPRPTIVQGTPIILPIGGIATP
jgi:hypothetical protein